MIDNQERFPNEKRRSPRISGAVVEYSIGKRAKELQKAFIKDICIHGVCIFMHEEVEINRIIYMDIYLFGSDTPIKTKGRVVWHKGGEYLGHYNVGIEFKGMQKEDKTRLAEHIKANIEQE